MSSVVILVGSPVPGNGHFAQKAFPGASARFVSFPRAALCPPVPESVNQALNHIPSATSAHLLNTCRDSDSTTSLGSLFCAAPSLDHHFSEEIFPLIQSKPPGTT